MEREQAHKLLNKVQQDAEELLRVSYQQQSLLSSGQLGEELQSLFEKRDALFDSLKESWEAFLRLQETDKNLRSDPLIQEKDEAIHALTERLAQSDGLVQILLGHHMEKVAFALVQQAKLQHAVSQYKTVHRQTSAIGRMFPGTSRRIDEGS